MDPRLRGDDDEGKEDRGHCPNRDPRPVTLAAARDLSYIAGIFHMGDLEEAGSEPGTGAEDVWRNQVWPTQRN